MYLHSAGAFKVLKKNGECTMKKALIIANILFASATVWGMDSNVNENWKAVRQDQMIQVNEQTENTVLESVAEMFQNAEKIAMEVEKFRKAREEIRKVINQDTETIKQFFTIIQYTPNLKKMTLDDIKKLDSEEIQSELLRRGHEIPVGFIKALSPDTIQGIFSDIDAYLFSQRFALTVDSGLINRRSILKLLLLGKHQIRLTTDQIENIVISDTGVSALIESCMQEFPLHYAYEKGHADVVKSLIDSGMDVDQPDGGVEGGETLLDKAIRKGDKAMVEYLVSHNANVNREYLGRYPLFQAFYSMNLDMMKCLVENGADLNLRDFRGFTILQAVQEELRKMDLYLSQLDRGNENNFDEDLRYEMNDRGLNIADAKLLIYQQKSLAEDIIQYLEAHGAIE